MAVFFFFNLKIYDSMAYIIPVYWMYSVYTYHMNWMFYPLSWCGHGPCLLCCYLIQTSHNRSMILSFFPVNCLGWCIYSFRWWLQIRTHAKAPWRCNHPKYLSAGTYPSSSSYPPSYHKVTSNDHRRFPTFVSCFKLCWFFFLFSLFPSLVLNDDAWKCSHQEKKSKKQKPN